MQILLGFIYIFEIECFRIIFDNLGRVYGRSI